MTTVKKPIGKIALQKNAKPNQATKTATKPITTAESEAPKVRTPKVLQTLRGVRDILPIEQPYWEHLRATCQRLAREYGFERIDPPVLEPTALFERGVGKVTDIVEKEMFTFADRGGDSISLRPEFTAGLARAYIEHGMLNQPQPIKWYTEGSLYRYQRPQYGRQREFSQWDWEVIGDPHPVIDASLIMLVVNLFRDLGIPVAIQLNTLGDTVCRPLYLRALSDYYRSHKKELCESCLERLAKNPLRLLDCKEPQCQPLKAAAPQLVDSLCDPCRDHFTKLLEYLDEVDVPYVLNPLLVRGLDYYVRTVFEVWSAEDEHGKTALGGGGRYDGLIELLGGRPTPACGLAIGMDVAVIKMREANVALPQSLRPDVFIAQLGEPAKRKALKLYEELRSCGIVPAANFSKDGLKSQMDMADKLGVRYAVILGQKEINDGTVIIRDMEAGIQEIYDFRKALGEIQRKLGNNRHRDPGHQPEGAMEPIGNVATDTMATNMSNENQPELFEE